MAHELFRTPSGSRLYGLAHPGSDIDIFVVTDSRNSGARHHTGPEADYSWRGLETFLWYVAEGSHQSCEAAFSPYLEFTEKGRRWEPLIRSIRVASPDAFAKYERTIKRFAFGDFKRRRHAVRLMFNLADLRKTGRFNPVMTQQQVDTANELATAFCDIALAEFLVPGVSIDAEEQAAYEKLGRSRFGRAPASHDKSSLR